MVGPGKKGRNIFSALNVFHHGADDRDRLLGRSSRPHTSDGGHAHDQRRNWQDGSPTQKAVSLESPRSESAPHSGGQNVDKPLPPAPIEAREATRSLATKPSLKPQKSANFKMMGRHERTKSKSPGKWQISAPYDPKKLSEIHGSMNPFDEHDQVSRGLVRENSAVMVSNKQLNKHKQPVPRSTSAFSFGSMFKFGTGKNKAALGKTKTGWFTHLHQRRHSEADDEGEDEALWDTLPPSVSATPAVARNMLVGDHKGRRDDEQIQDDIQAHRVIDQSPKLQNFFFGTKLFEEGAPAGSPKNISYGSPTKMARRSMTGLRKDNQGSLLFDEDNMMGKSGTSPTHRAMRSTMYSSRFNRNQSTSALLEPTFLFGGRSGGRQAYDDQESYQEGGLRGQAPPGPEKVKEKPEIVMVSAEEFHANGTYDEERSGLRHHPGVMECVEPPAWYADAFRRGIVLPTPTKTSSYGEAHTRHHTRRFSTYIAPGFPLQSDSALEYPPPVPRLQLKRASDASKRGSMEAEVAQDSPGSSNRNRNSSISDDLIEHVRLVSAFDMSDTTRDGSEAEEEQEDEVDDDDNPRKQSSEIGMGQHEDTNDAPDDHDMTVVQASYEETEQLRPQVYQAPQSENVVQTMAPRRRSMPPPTKNLMTPDCNFNAQWPYRTHGEAFTQVNFDYVPPMPTRAPPPPPQNSPATPPVGRLRSTPEERLEDFADDNYGHLEDETFEDDVGLAL